MEHFCKQHKELEPDHSDFIHEYNGKWWFSHVVRTVIEITHCPYCGEELTIRSHMCNVA